MFGAAAEKLVLLLLEAIANSVSGTKKEVGIRAFHLKRDQESGDGDSLLSLTELETKL